MRGNVVNNKLGKNYNFDDGNKIMDLIIPYRTNVYFLIKILPILLIPKNIFRLIYRWKGKLNESFK